MRKKRTLLLCAACALLALLAFFVFKPTSTEPSYAGHPLNYWVNVLGTATIQKTSTTKRQLLSTT